MYLIPSSSIRVIKLGGGWSVEEMVVVVVVVVVVAGVVILISPANKKVLKSMHGGNGLRNEKVTTYHNPLVPSP